MVTTPTIVGSVTDAQLNGAHGVQVIGRYAYVAALDYAGLTIVDVANPAAPSIVGTITDAQLNGARDVQVIGRYAYVAAYDYDGLTIVDVSN